MNFLAQQATNSIAEAPPTEFLANLSVGMIGFIALVLSLVRFALLNPTSNRPPANLARGIAEFCESILVALVLVFLLIRPFLLQAFFIPSQSMENTLLGHSAGVDGYTDTVNDHIFVNKLVFRYSAPQHKDIIVFRAPKDADGESRQRGLPQVENVLIKRVIGVPGDTIQVKEVEVKEGGEKKTIKAVFRNGERLIEPYTKEPMDGYPGAPPFAGITPLKLAPDQYFVMGDNRNNSNDSRFWGVVTRDRVIGKASFIFMPFNRMGLIR